jgi:hypothetical protein
MVYVGDARCSACRSEGFKEDLDETLEHLGEIAERQGEEFYPIGVLIGADPVEGLEQLVQQKGWAEISLGGGWLNTHVLAEIWDWAGIALTPQVFVYRREVVTSGDTRMVVDQTTPRVIRGAVELAHILEQGEWNRLLPPLSARDTIAGTG